MPAASIDTHPQRAQADLILLAATVGWGVTFAIVKNALDDVSPGAYLASRFLLGTAVAVLLARRSLAHLPSLRAGALLGVFLWAGFALNTWGLRYTTATRSGFLTSLCVVLVPILGALVFSSRVGVPAYAGALTAGAGLFVMSSRALSLGDASLLGDGLTVASAVAYAFHILFTGRIAPKVVPSAAMAGQLAVVALLSLALLPFEEVRFQPTPALLGTLLFTGIFASALFIYMQLWAQARTPPVRAALLLSLQPLFAAVFARAIRSEPLGAETWAGGGLIVVGILISEVIPWSALRRARVQAEPAE